MDYKIKDIEKTFDGEITENLGNNEYVININNVKHQIKILKMDSKGVEFALDQKIGRAHV